MRKMDISKLEKAYNLVVNDKSKRSSFMIFPDGQIASSDAGRILYDKYITDLRVVSGSFNPLHEGHKQIFESAERSVYGHNTVYEISLSRKDKEFISLEDLAIRLKQFEWYQPVLVNNACLFVEKAGLLFSAIFHIGYDTAKRLIEYHGTIGVQGINADFCVYGRSIDGRFLDFHYLKEEFSCCPENMSEGILLNKNFSHISSTKIRENK